MAEDARRQAEVQRDDANRQRDETEKQLLITQLNLQTAEEAVAALKAYDPKAAAQLTTELAAAGSTADKELKALTEERERLRRERDAALESVKKLNQENAALRQNPQSQSRPAPAPANEALSPSSPVAVPNLIRRTLGDAEAELRTLGLYTSSTVVDADAPRGTIVSQAPAARSQIVRGAVVQLTVSAGPEPVRPPAPVNLGTSDEVSQVMRTLQRYKAGYEALDAKAIAAVYPTVNVATLQSRLNQFGKLSYDVKLHVDGVVVAPDGQTASVTASETFRFTPKIGSAPPQTGTAVFTMRNAAGAWIIQSVKSDTR